MLRAIQSERVFGAVERAKYEHERFFGALALLNRTLTASDVCDKTFEAVQWRDSRCYAIGERTDDLLLFCAELSPRNRIVKKNDQALVHLNVTESIFSQFGRKAE